MINEWYLFLGWIITVFVLATTLRDRTEIYAKAMTDSAKIIARAIKQSRLQTEKTTTSETTTSETANEERT